MTTRTIELMEDKERILRRPNDKRLLERVMVGLRHAQRHLSSVYPAIYRTSELITRAKCDLLAGKIDAAQSHLDAAADQLDGLAGIADPPIATTECALTDHKLQACIDRLDTLFDYDDGERRPNQAGD